MQSTLENFQALRRADEVRTFPSIQMPPPVVFKVHTAKTTYTRSRELLADKKPKVDRSPLPGLLKAKKTTLESNRTSDTSTNIFTGFNPVSLKLDVGSTIPKVYEDKSKMTGGAGGDSDPVTATTAGATRRLSRVEVGAMVEPTSGTLPRTSSSVSIPSANPIRNPPRLDNTVEELRNYIVLMDKYSLHNFLIYDGHALKDTPEFQSFQRSYQYQWGAISLIIYQLESFLGRHDVKLAIVNGPRLVQMAKLNLPSLKRGELLSCLANSAQIEASIETGSDFVKKQLVRSVVQIQAIVRMYLAVRRFKWKRKAIHAAVIIQAIARRMLERMHHKDRMKRHVTLLNEQWIRNRKRLEDWWKTAFTPVNVSSSSSSASSTPSNSTSIQYNRSRLIIFLPSLSVSEKIRLEYDNYTGLQNTCLSHLYQLADPNVQFIYISPVSMSPYQTQYHEKLLALLGISILPKRLTILVPEMSDKLPPCMTLAQQLWCSVGTLRKIKALIKRNKYAELVCNTLGWAERRIGNYLGIPLTACDPLHAQVLTNRSALKNFLMEHSVSIPIGAHDIVSMEDLLVALSRLIAANVGIMRWIVRLNCDNNQEGVAFIDIEKTQLILQLRGEQREIVGEKESLSAWFARTVQIEVRKRILSALRAEFHQIVRLARKDIYPNWEQFAKQMHQVGAVVEAEVLEKLGTVVSPCFITPQGEIQQLGGMECVCDEFGQIQAYIYPQHITPPLALQSVTNLLGKKLFEDQQVVGHATFHFISHWDGLDAQPRLQASDLTLGATNLFGAYGTASIACDKGASLSLSLIPKLPEGRSFVYVPLAIHDPLRGTRDDHFFKLCRLKGIAYDADNQVGTLFFLADSVMGGGISILCLGKTRKKSIELAIHTLTFVQKHYGIDLTAGSTNKYENLTNMLGNLKKVLKKEGDLPIAAR